MGNSKVELADGTVLVDLTGDTVNASSLASGYTAHGPDGNPIVGEFKQQQADWNQTDTTANDYIKNKPTNVSEFTNDAGYTNNIGTVTGIKINGATKNPSSGVVDLGTVITSHQSLANYITNTTKLIRRVQLTVQNQSITKNSYVNVQFTTPSISGFTFAGVVYCYIKNGTTSGSNATNCCIGGIYPANNAANIMVRVRNEGSNTAKVDVEIGVLMVASGIYSSSVG